ncbi:hypothetical protein VNO78_06308 [Psophocarpus tetragonolobus]|uniref:Uncharacterized protein n=1 Tax=Psophocarpus tetragonolobus TaxID=3891 RepID=A0AAN9XR05_PSOTE
MRERGDPGGERIRIKREKQDSWQYRLSTYFFTHFCDDFVTNEKGLKTKLDDIYIGDRKMFVNLPRFDGKVEDGRGAMVQETYHNRTATGADINRQKDGSEFDGEFYEAKGLAMAAPHDSNFKKIDGDETVNGSMGITQQQSLTVARNWDLKLRLVPTISEQKQLHPGARRNHPNKEESRKTGGESGARSVTIHYILGLG